MAKNLDEALDDADDVPFYPDAFEAWRGWRVEKGVLKSVNDGQIWVPGVAFEAECSSGKQHKTVPWPRCTCGLYSVKTLTKLQKNNYHTAGAFGKVAIWGEMIESSEGYKSQFAYPTIIYVAHLSFKKATALENRYGVPVRLRNPYRIEVEE